MPADYYRVCFLIIDVHDGLLSLCMSGVRARPSLALWKMISWKHIEQLPKGTCKWPLPLVAWSSAIAEVLATATTNNATYVGHFIKARERPNPKAKLVPPPHLSRRLAAESWSGKAAELCRSHCPNNTASRHGHHFQLHQKRSRQSLQYPGSSACKLPGADCVLLEERLDHPLWPCQGGVPRLCLKMTLQVHSPN